MNLSLFIAKRISATDARNRQVSRPAVTIATAGVAIGIAVMLISVSVVLGFKHTIRDKVIGFGNHIQITNYELSAQSLPLPITANDSLKQVIRKTPGVKSIHSFAYKQGILKTNSDFLGVMFEGVGADYDTTFIAQHLTEGKIPAFSDSKSGNKILISKKIAQTLKLKINDRIFAYFIDHNGLRVRRFTVSGIYDTNLSQFDKAICFTDLYTVNKLNKWFPQQVSGIGVTLSDMKYMPQAQNYLINQVNRTNDSRGAYLVSQTIDELYPQIFSWLSLLDLNVWVILALMISVAAVTMSSGLLIIILERTNMIGTLKALGARNALIRRIFLWHAFFIIGKGMLIGNIISIVLLGVQYYTGIIKLDPEIYYVTQAPVEFNWLIVLAVNLLTLIICLFVLIAPSYLASAVQPAKSMKYE